MTRIRANRESIDDRFSVLGFTVNADQPLYEIALATEPDLFKPEHRARRTAGNFYASPLQGARVRNDNVYLVPPSVVARFVGQPRLYFGVATYADTDRAHPVTVRRPDSGHMYVSLRGLTERGLRRGVRNGQAGNGSSYGTATPVPGWGGDAAPGTSTTPAAQTGNGNGNGTTAPAPYNDGYSDDLWQQPPAATTTAPTATPPATSPDPAATAPATAQSLHRVDNGHAFAGNGHRSASAGSRQSYARDGRGEFRVAPHSDRYDDGFGPAPPARRPQSGVATLAPTARALRVVSSYYNPTDWLDALRTQIGFFAASVQWWAGVDNTTVLPHSAICQARTVDGSAEGGQHGSAFFIAPNLLLTAAHVVDGQSELIIVPGKNGAGTGSANEPFGRFHVSAADMVKHPSYVSSSRDFDIALIRVPAANASSNYFDLVEELTQSRPEGVVVSGYAAYSDPQGIIDSVVNATIDADKQHVHGGFIRSLPTDETFDYDLQSLGGTSGSPVYYIENGDAPRTHMVGVHVAGHSDTTNLGCRITPAKLAWIRQQAAAWSQSLTFSLGARALSDDAGASGDAAYDEAEGYSHVPEPVEAEFAEAQALRTRAFTTAIPDYPGASRFVPAHARNFRAGRRRDAVIDRIVIHITAGGPNIGGTISWFQDGERRDPKTGQQAGPSSAHYIVGRDGEVVQMVRNADTAYHASSANGRSIGIEHNANKPYRLNRRDLPPTMEQYQASAHLVAWLAAQYGIPLDRTHIVGHIEATPGDNHDCPSSYWDWDTYMQCVQLAADALANNSSTGAVPVTSQGVRGRPRARAYSADPGHFSWPSSLGEAGHWVQAFASEYNQRINDGAYGAPAPDPAQYTAVEDADAIARSRTRRDIVERMGRDLQTSARRDIEQGLIALATAAATQVLDLVANDLPPTPYAIISTDAREEPPAPPTHLTVPTALPAISRRVGMFLAWIDAGTQLANTDVAARIAAHRQQWQETQDLVGTAGTLLGFLPGLGGVVATGVEQAVQALLQASPPDFDRPQRDHAGAMTAMRHAYRDLTAHLLRGLLLARYPSAPVVTHLPLKPELESIIREHAVHVLGGWQDELRFLGVGLDTMAQSLRHAPTPPRAQGKPRAPVRAQELITPYYDPSNPASALQCTADAFSQQREEWFVGVDSTDAFPHSAICHISMVDTAGDTYTGTGFYIGPHRILTCAHNLHGMVSATVTPARNGAGSAPFGQFHLSPSQWRVAPRYTGDGDWDNDLAVIDNTEIGAPHGAFFRFMQATPGGTLPLAVCGYSAGSRLVRELNPLIDRNRQHLHGGNAKGQATFDTIDYDILAIAGASGSPVYTVRDEGNGLEAFVCGVHVTRGPIESSGAPSVNRACFITPAKIDWIEGRATTFGFRGARAQSADGVEHRVALVPQPDKKACWAASMAMLKSFRSDASFDPEAFVREAGGSLSTSYDWNQLERVRDHYGFAVIEQPSNASLYHTPAQWAQWLRDVGPLWVVIVGAPHAVVVSGIRGDLANAAATEVYVLNPWDTTTAFDQDPVAFNPPNRGHEGWMAFESFAADFGNMAQPDYGNWRVLHLPATRAQAQSLNARGPYRLAPAPRSLSADAPEPIEPSRVPNTRMHVVRGSAGGSRWALDQLEGRKPPTAAMPAVSSLQPTDVVIELGEWPALEGQAAPLPLTVRFHSGADGSVGDVVVTAGTPTQLAYGVDVTARIEDAADTDGVAALRVDIDVRFSGLAAGAPRARIELRLLGNGRYERSNRWMDTSLAA
jgi:V8-like Glu-specific endopeptidase